MDWGVIYVIYGEEGTVEYEVLHPCGEIELRWNRLLKMGFGEGGSCSIF